MFAKLASAGLVASVLGLTLVSTSAEAGRRLLWWEEANSDQPAPYDIYNDPHYDASSAYEQDGYNGDQFNQEQYDLYMRERHHRQRQQRYDQSYYDPQVDGPNYAPPVAKHKSSKPKKILPTPSYGQSNAIGPKAVASLPQANQTALAHKGIDCSHGAAIVAGYGFASIASKNCSGALFTYDAARGGKNFEVEVNSVNGEITAVRKL